jgi:hypothetical protein
MRKYSNPVFQHRHYAEIASLLAQLDGKDSPEGIREAFATMFQRDNGKFDRSRFLAAANGSPSNGRDKR